LDKQTLLLEKGHCEIFPDSETCSKIEGECIAGFMGGMDAPVCRHKLEFN